MMSRTAATGSTPSSAAASWVAAAGLLATMGTDTPKALPAFYMFLAGAGANGASQVLIVAVQNQVPHSDLGIATSATSFFRSLGSVAAPRSTARCCCPASITGLPRLVPDGSGVQRGAAHAEPQADPGDGTEVRTGIVQSFANSLGTVFLWLVPVAVILVLLALAVPEHPLRDTAAISGTEDDDASPLSVKALP